jgi:hypothetical protein
MNDRLKMYRWADRVTTTAAKLNMLLEEAPAKVPNPPEIPDKLIDRLVGLTGHTPAPIAPQVEISATDEFRRRLEFVVEWLNTSQTRATYGAVADLLEVNTRVLLNHLGERRPRMGWIVNAKTGLPTGYEAAQYPDGFSGSSLISNGSMLEKLISTPYESGYWSIDEGVASKLSRIYLHRAQAASSFFGGRITGYRVQPDGKWKGRIVFEFLPDVTQDGQTDRWNREQAVEGASIHLIHRGNTGLLRPAS